MIRAGFLALLSLVSSAAGAQLPSMVTDVQRQAPHLMAFAGSPANFQNLVVGLAQSGTITLTTPLQDGTAEVASFNSAVPLSSTDVVTVLERARQSLAAVGILQPSAAQLGAALAGGTVNTAAAAAQLPGVLPHSALSGGVRAQRFFVGVPGALPTPAPATGGSGLAPAAPLPGAAAGGSIPNSPAFTSQTPGFPAAGGGFPSQAPAPAISPRPVAPQAR